MVRWFYTIREVEWSSLSRGYEDSFMLGHLHVKSTESLEIIYQNIIHWPFLGKVKRNYDKLVLLDENSVQYDIIFVDENNDFFSVIDKTKILFSKYRIMLCILDTASVVLLRISL